MLLFFDTETTGFMQRDKLIDDPTQPHVVQLAALLTEDDGTERSAINLIVNPGVSIPKAASDVHKITNPIAKKCGVAPLTARNVFANLMSIKGVTLVAHNTKFDKWLMRTLFARTSKSKVDIETLPAYCTMEGSTDIVNLPPTEKMIACGFNKPKAPTLEEAYEFFFGKKLEGAHDALVDVRACKDVYFAIKAHEAENPTFEDDDEDWLS